LALQIRDLLFGVGDPLFTFRNLLFAFGYLTAEFFDLSQKPLIFLSQLFTARLLRVAMVLCLCPLSPCPASRTRIHPG
jgi:hypothetical protein